LASLLYIFFPINGGIFMLDEKILEILATAPDSALALATNGPEGAHLVNSWNSYVQLYQEEMLLIPAGRMVVTEANLERDNRILMTICHRDVEGKQYKGSGFLLKGEGSFVQEGEAYKLVKEKFPWARAALVIKVTEAEQTL